MLKWADLGGQGLGSGSGSGPSSDPSVVKCSDVNRSPELSAHSVAQGCWQRVLGNERLPYPTPAASWTLGYRHQAGPPGTAPGPGSPAEEWGRSPGWLRAPPAKEPGAEGTPLRGLLSPWHRLGRSMMDEVGQESPVWDWGLPRHASTQVGAGTHRGR